MAMRPQKVGEFGRREAAARRQHLMRRLGDMGEAEETGRVRLRGEVKVRILGRQQVDVGQIQHRHRHQIAVAQHRPLGSAGRAAGIEDPGEILAAALADRGRFGPRQPPPVGLAQRDEAGMGVERRRERRGEIGGREAEFRAAVGGDESDFARVQFGVGGNRDQPGAPEREQDRQIFRIVGHRQHDPVARLQARRRQAAGEPSRQRPVSRIVVEPPVADGDGGTVGEGARGRFEEVGEIHVARSSTVIATAASSMPRKPPPFSTNPIRAPGACRAPATPRSCETISNT